MDEADKGLDEQAASSDKRSTSAPQGKEKERRSYGILSIALVSFIVSALMLAAYHEFMGPPPRILTMDLRAFVAAQRDAMIKGELTEEQFKANLDKLEDAVNSARPNDVVIMKDVVLRGGTMIEIPTETVKSSGAAR